MKGCIKGYLMVFVWTCLDPAVPCLTRGERRGTVAWSEAITQAGSLACMKHR